MLKAMAAMQAEALKSSTWVGDSFAEDVRAMHPTSHRALRQWIPSAVSDSVHNYSKTLHAYAAV